MMRQSPKFICRYPTPQSAAAMTYEEFQTFAREHRYSRPRKLPGCFAKIQSPQLRADPEVTAIYQKEAVTLAKLLLEMIQVKKQTQKELTSLFEQHPDHQVFDSLPAVS